MIKLAFQKIKICPEYCKSTILPIPEQNSTSAARPPELGSWSQYMPPKFLFLTSQCTNYKIISENELRNIHSTELIKVATLTTSSSLLEIPRFLDFAMDWWWTERQHLMEWFTISLSLTILHYSFSLVCLLQFALYKVVHFPNSAPK